MKATVSIGLIGDYSPEVTAHVAIPKALALAGSAEGVEVIPTWLPTSSIADGSVSLEPFDGLWCVPASPYQSMEGALLAIRFAREQHRPFLGTCGGFQHVLIEYARNALGFEEADHAESNPAAVMPLIAPLACSLVGARGSIRLKEGSTIARIYGQSEIVEQFHCQYGLDARYRSLIERGSLEVIGVDAEGDPRAVELKGHPFFMATLFQPERSALSDLAHPLIRAYVRAASKSDAS